MLTEIQQRHYTPEEYLELEEKADTKNDRENKNEK